MGQLPSQLRVLRAMVNTANELGGLRDNLYRLVTDVGPGIDVNSSLGRRRPDGRWEIDRILIRGHRGGADTSEIRLKTQLTSDGPAANAPACTVYFPVRAANDPRVEHPISNVLPVILPPQDTKMLVTLVATLPDPAQGEPGVLWVGTLAHTFTPDNGPPDEEDTHPLFFWVPAVSES